MGAPSAHGRSLFARAPFLQRKQTYSRGYRYGRLRTIKPIRECDVCLSSKFDARRNLQYRPREALSRSSLSSSANKPLSLPTQLYLDNHPIAHGHALCAQARILHLSEPSAQDILETYPKAKKRCSYPNPSHPNLTSSREKKSAS
jgi:hypothetical protein